MSQPYRYLSRYYDARWGDFCLQYVPVIQALLAERGIFSARILDLACGTGNLVQALAGFGHTVSGLDASPEMVRIARKKAPDIKFTTGDMLSLDAVEEYDIVTCVFDSLNYLRRLPEVRTLFRNVAAALKPGGRFLFDATTVLMYRHQAGSAESRSVDGQLIIEETVYNTRYRLATTTFSFPDGSFEIHRQRPYSYEILAPRLEQAGLRVIARFSWLPDMPYSPQSPRFHVIAEKP